MGQVSGKVEEIEKPKEEEPKKEEDAKKEEKPDLRDDFKALVTEVVPDEILSTVWEANHDIARQRQMFEHEYMEFLRDTFALIKFDEPIYGKQTKSLSLSLSLSIMILTIRNKQKPTRKRHLCVLFDWPPTSWIR